MNVTAVKSDNANISVTAKLRRVILKKR